MRLLADVVLRYARGVPIEVRLADLLDGGDAAIAAISGQFPEE